MNSCIFVTQHLLSSMNFSCMRQARSSSGHSSKSKKNERKGGAQKLDGGERVGRGEVRGDFSIPSFYRAACLIQLSLIAGRALFQAHETDPRGREHDDRRCW